MSWENESPHRLGTVAGVEAVIGRPLPMIMLKQVSALDDGCRAVLARSPIAAFGYRDTDGTSRTTFVGGAAGFARVHSPTRISFPLPGSGAARGPVSLFFLLPGVGEVLRVNGSVSARQRAAPLVTVDIAEAFVHCAQAVLRSRLWQPPAAAPPIAPPPAAPPPAAAPPAAAPPDVSPPAATVAGDGPLAGPGIAEFLAAAPFLAMSTWDRSGGSDTSPRGDVTAAARILDGRTLVIPDRKGNKRADTLHNLLEDDRLSLAALVPGRTGVLQVRGRGVITGDPALLATMALRGMAPHAALVIDVEHAEITGSDPVARSRMWHRSSHAARGSAPDLMAVAAGHLAANTAASRGGLLLRAVGAIPGMSRLMRLAMNRAYRTGLRKEGYDEVTPDPLSTTDEGTAPAPRAVRVAELRRETPTAVTLVLEDTGDSRDPFHFRPGQFFTLVTDVDGRPVRRAYSASSAPGTPRLEITVKLIDGGRFSSHVHHTLRPGDHLALLGPSGSFHAEAEPPAQTVLIAAGSGITPLMSMIRTRLATHPARGRIALLYSSRTPDDVIFAADLTRLAADFPGTLSVTHVLTSTEGRLTTDRVRDWVSGLTPAPDTHYYICGPEPLTDAVRAALIGLEVPDAHVHHERYTGGADPATASTAPQHLTVTRAGRPVGTAIVEPGGTLLDAGLTAGLPLPYSCTVGSCGDCMVKLSSGKVTQDAPNCLTPTQKAEGYILTCTGRPLSPVTLDIADAAAPGGLADASM